MKKALILVGILFVALLVFAGLLISERLDNVNNRAEIVKYLAQGIQENSLAAEMEGERVSLNQSHSARLLEILCWGQAERRREWNAPANYKEKITLYMGDLALTLYELHGSPQTNIIEKDIGGRKRWSSLEKYNLVMWLKKAVGFEE